MLTLQYFITQLARADVYVSLHDIMCTYYVSSAHVFEASDDTHQRAVNQLCYHPKEANTILTGSQDHTMCCFVSV